MPELPEVETIVRGLETVLPGRIIRAVRWSGVRFPSPVTEKKLAAGLTGRRFATVTRRGKYLSFGLDDGAQLVAHLRMTGKFVFLADAAAQAVPPHGRALFLLDGGAALWFIDMRRFGTLALFPAGEIPPAFAALGPEPLSPGFTAAALLAAAAGRTVPVKQFLLDQRVVAGIGNIYASEALFRARVSPFLPSGALSREQAARLVRALRQVLREAIRHNGTTISDFRRVDEKSGEYQEMLRVYGRAGQACRDCATPVVRAVQGQRSTFYCPRCQGESVGEDR